MGRGKKIDEAELKDLLHLPNIKKRFEIKNDTVFMYYKFLSSKDLEELKLKNDKESEVYRTEFINKKSPSFLLTDLNGIVYTQESLRGRIVVLNFWFVGCKPCRREIPDLNLLVQKNIGKDVVFIALALDQKEELQNFLLNNEFSYKIIPESEKVAELFKVNSYPTHIIIDKMGVVKELLIGYNDHIGREIEKIINSLGVK